MKGIVIYKGKYGATRQYAIWIGTALGLPVAPAGAETMEQLADADYVVMGSSIYIGKLQLQKWIKANERILATKRLFLFLVAGTSPDEKEKLEGYIKANLPEELRRRCQCFFYPGKLEFSKLSWTDKLLLKMGAWLSKSTKDEIPLADYNAVNRNYIAGLINNVNYLQVV